MTQVTSCKTEDKTASTVKVFPNPSTGIFTINIQPKERFNAGINIRNIMGQVIYTIPAKHITGNCCNPSTLPAKPKGMYLVEIVMAGKRITEKDHPTPLLLIISVHKPHKVCGFIFCSQLTALWHHLLCHSLVLHSFAHHQLLRMELKNSHYKNDHRAAAAFDEVQHVNNVIYVQWCRTLPLNTGILLFPKN